MSTYTASLGLEEITPGDQAGLWGNTTNNNLELIDQAVTGVTPISFAALSGTVRVLDSANGALDEARAAVINITGTAAGSNTVVVPNRQKMYLVRNNTGQGVIFRTASPSATYTVDAGNSILVFCDGNNNVFTGIQAPGSGTLGVSGGGTGATAFTAGFVISPGGTNNLTTQPAIGVGGTTTTQITGEVQVPNGGTGLANVPAGSLLVGNGVLDMAVVSPATAGHVLTSNGAGANPSFQAPSAAAVSSIIAGTGISVSSPTGAVTISNTTLSSANTWTGTNTFSNTLTANGVSTFNGNTNFENTGLVTIKSNALTYGLYTGGTTTANSMFFGSGSINFWDTNNITGNQFNSIYYTSQGSTNLGSQIYVFNYKTPGVSSGTSAYIFAGDGTASKTGGGSWASISDARLKDNVTPLTGALAKITALNPVNYAWKINADNTPTVGFIAQEVQEVIPNAVKSFKSTKEEAVYTDGKTLGISWQNDMTAYLVGAIKELKAELDAAKAEIAALKARV